MTETYTMDGPSFAGMLRTGAAVLGREKQAVNDLNVFPIPDGDTGDNMYMTIKTGCEALDAGAPGSVSDTASAVSGRMLLGARGNSGVILSRIFAGLAKGLEGLESAGVADFANAMNFAVKEAYSAVSNPVEGTIITVLREGVAGADSQGDFSRYFNTLLGAMRTSLEHTPELLKVLKDNGVVDSGGAGLVYIVEGMKNAVEGAVDDGSALSPASGQAPSIDLSIFGEDSVLEFGYCTEFLLRLQSSKVDLAGFDEKPLVDWLNSHGESVVAFRDGSIFKVHVHTFHPGEVFNYMQQFGEFLTVKVENMTLQHHQTGNENNAYFRAPAKKYGIVTVASGEGLSEAFRQIGADVVIPGGQTMNPSVDVILQAVKKANARNVLILPNNPNIILAAQSAAESAECKVLVVPSKTIVAGISAMIGFDPDGGAEENCEAMTELLENVLSGSVTFAVRDTAFEGKDIKENDVIGILESKIEIVEKSVDAAAEALIEKMLAQRGDDAIVSLFYGADTKQEDAQALCDRMQQKYSSAEFVVQHGGQPLYYYYIAVE